MNFELTQSALRSDWASGTLSFCSKHWQQISFLSKNNLKDFYRNISNTI